MSDALTGSIAATVKAARTERELSVAALAERSGVSRAMIAKIESDDASPTAALLGKLSGALGLTLSELVARAEGGSGRRLVRAGDQVSWTDPGTGYTRRSVSPVSGGPLELVQVQLPPGARVAYPADAFTLSHHQIWVLDGPLLFVEGEVEHRLETGDCLQLGPPAPCVYVNPSERPCRYLVALARR